MIFVASNLPPIPHSRMAMSQPLLAKKTNAIAVNISNSVGASFIFDDAFFTMEAHALKSSNEIFSPFTVILSR